MRLLSRILLSAALSALALSAQSSVLCTVTSNPSVVRAEGIAERVGDLVFSCSGGAPGAVITGNLSIFLNVNVTNALASNNTITGVTVTNSNGSGVQTLTTPATLPSASSLVFNGLSFQLSPTGTTTLQVSNIRANASQLNFAFTNDITATLAFNSSVELVGFPSNTLVVGVPEYGLYSSYASALSIINPPPSPVPGQKPGVPGQLTYNGLLNSQVPFFSTRVTEGFASAFAPLNAVDSQGANTGTRILVQYSGLPATAQVYVPTLVAGSDALIPTAAGDLGLAYNSGQYQTTPSGSLLLALVSGADASGNGGIVTFDPTQLGQTSLTLDSVNQLTIAGGVASAVYEVVDANPSVVESAQFPTWIYTPPPFVGQLIPSDTVTLAPLSSIVTASTTAPIPRFVMSPSLSDCPVLGDCAANYFPHLRTVPTAVQFTLPAGGPYQSQYVAIQNSGSGTLNFTASLTFPGGEPTSWLTLYTTGRTLRLDATPSGLTPGVYQASIIVNAGSAGATTVPVTLTVTPGTLPVPAITSVVNAAGFGPGVVPGSLATVFGTGFPANPYVTFGGQQVTVLFANSTQINVLVPQTLSGTTATMVLVAALDGRLGLTP